MTEIPEHLLARSRARREAAGLATPSDAAAPATTASAGAPAAAATAAAPAKAAAPKAPAPKPAKPDPAYIKAYKTRKKIPWWAIPAVAGLPLWAFLYVFTLETPTASANDPLTLGATAYQNCAACHGSTGGGGAGPALDAGSELSAVFPDYKEHIRWVEIGSADWPEPTFGATGKIPGAGGAMPGWASQLTPEQIVYVVRYEREVLAQMPPEDELVALSNLAAAGEDITAMLAGDEPIPAVEETAAP